MLQISSTNAPKSISNDEKCCCMLRCCEQEGISFYDETFYRSKHYMHEVKGGLMKYPHKKLQCECINVVLPSSLTPSSLCL